MKPGSCWNCARCVLELPDVQFSQYIRDYNVGKVGMRLWHFTSKRACSPISAAQVNQLSSWGHSEYRLGRTSNGKHKILSIPAACPVVIVRPPTKALC